MKKIILAFCLLQASLSAKEPYHVLVQVDVFKDVVSAPNLVDLNRKLRTSSLQELIPSYTPDTAAAFGINLRGLKAEAFFADYSTTLQLAIPKAGIVASFTGATRDESFILFKSFIKESRALPRLLKAYARYSPIDPIAGNPSSLMAQMAESDYLLGRLSPYAGCFCSSGDPIIHQFQTGMKIGRNFSDEYDATLINLPLRYCYSSEEGWAIILDAPFTYIRNGGASSIAGSFGVGFRFPAANNWSLTPVFRLGTAGSLDLCTSGNFAACGITSNFDLPVSHYVASLTNYIGYITSANFWLTGVNFNYHLNNTIYKNGIAFSSCEGFFLGTRKINFRIGIEDSYFAGDKLFIRHFDRIELALFTAGILPCASCDLLETSFSFMWGQKNFHGYWLNFLYQF